MFDLWLVVLGIALCFVHPALAFTVWLAIGLCVEFGKKKKAADPKTNRLPKAG